MLIYEVSVMHYMWRKPMQSYQWRKYQLLIVLLIFKIKWIWIWFVAKSVLEKLTPNTKHQQKTKRKFLSSLIKAAFLIFFFVVFFIVSLMTPFWIAVPWPLWLPIKPTIFLLFKNAIELLFFLGHTLYEFPQSIV